MSSVENPENQDRDLRDSVDPAAYAAAADAALVVASLVGDLAAFDVLAQRYRRAVQFVARQMIGTDTDAEEAAQDITQDVFVAAFQALPDLEEPAKFAGWLYAITRNRARRVAERERRVVSTEAATLETLTDAQATIPERTDRGDAMGDPAKRWERHCRRVEIWDALEQISQDHREVLFLHYCEEWPLFQIARFLSVPETTVKGRLFRAREALRQRLADRPDAFNSPNKPNKPNTPTLKGNQTHESNDKSLEPLGPIRQISRRDTAHPANAEADAPSGGALQPDRRAFRRGDRCGDAVQPDPDPARRTRRAVTTALPAASAGRLL